jgi:hypothetical protein
MFRYRRTEKALFCKNGRYPCSDRAKREGKSPELFRNQRRDSCTLSSSDAKGVQHLLALPIAFNTEGEISDQAYFQDAAQKFVLVV